MYQLCGNVGCEEDGDDRHSLGKRHAALSISWKHIRSCTSVENLKDRVVVNGERMKNVGVQRDLSGFQIELTKANR